LAVGARREISGLRGWDNSQVVDVSTPPHHLSQPGHGSDSSKRPWRGRAAALLVLALLAGLLIWAKLLPNVGANHVAPIDSATLSWDGRTLSLWPQARCLATITDRVVESATAVRILVHVKNNYSGQGPSCRSGVTVHLRSPLGQRKVIDQSTGKLLSVALPTNGVIVGKLVIETSEGAVAVPGTVSLTEIGGGVRTFGTDANGTFTVPSPVGAYFFTGHSPRFTVTEHAPGAHDVTVKGTCHSATFTLTTRQTIHVTIVCQRTGPTNPTGRG